MIGFQIWPNQKISSSEFETDGSWYLDLYPKGYRLDEDKSEYLSIYLHSSRKQVKSRDSSFRNNFDCRRRSEIQGNIHSVSVFSK